ncbi:hypothetical protein FE257_002144 [Aspergillus nanangensis]|uniref:Helicase-associated domain-containing protein n=1 Tax=Aspergillus nanangensis TaxID=2582783 RepID=A0AAD4CVA4_ASPNN|nr:hypothetical protein FE257_002144 [Aspergillus nanangensis]
MQVEDALKRSADMLRENLQATCLRAKCSAPRTQIQDFLSRSIEPPDEESVKFAVKDLQLLKSLDQKGELTPLGHLLTDFSLDPWRAKLVLLGIIFRCLDPLLIIGAIGSESLFYLSTDPSTRQRVEKSRLEFSNGSWSDHMSAANAVVATRDVWYQKGKTSAFYYAVSRHIHFDRVRETLNSARQTLGILVRKQLIPQPMALRNDFRYGGPDLNINSSHSPLIKALLAHAAYPNLAAPSQGSSRRYRTSQDSVTHIALNSAFDAAFYALATPRVDRVDTRNMSRDHLFNTLSGIMIDITGLDHDPVYTSRDN